MTNVTFKGIEEKPLSISGSYFGADFDVRLPVDSTTTEFFRAVLAAYHAAGFCSDVVIEVFAPSLTDFGKERVTTLTHTRGDGLNIEETERPKQT